MVLSIIIIQGSHRGRGDEREHNMTATDSFLNRLSFVAENEEDSSENRVGVMIYFYGDTNVMLLSYLGDLLRS